MTEPVTLLIVNYRSAELTSRAILSARKTTRTPLRVVIVDNSVDPEEVVKLRALEAVEVVASPDNVGYAAAINRAVATFRGGIVVASNPDVEFGPGCIDELVKNLGSSIAASGPRFWWDRDRSWLLPPPETMSFLQQLGTNLENRWLFRLTDRARRRARLRFWRRTSTASVPVLSGAVLAFDVETFQRLGGMDERFRLYFEEVDFARRAAEAGLSLRHVPTAGCRHLYGQSSSTEPQSAAWFEESRQLFNRKSFGRIGARILRARLGPVPDRSERWYGELPRIESPDSTVIELAAEPAFRMAAGFFPRESEIEIPKKALESSGFERVWFRAVSIADLKTLWTVSLNREDGW
ncbi:MAG: glycosyltransferase [Acidobacteria bacterium]|nr:glycosyltransferase [Acidobacteriota bacterium]